MAKARVASEATLEELTFIQLDEIAGLLKDQLDRMREAEPQGLLDQVALAIGPAVLEYNVYPPWYSVSLWNDGPNPVFVDVNTDANARTLNTAVNVNQNLAVVYDKPRIRQLFLATAPAQAANVRIYGTR